MTAMRVEETYGRQWSAAEEAVLRAEYGRQTVPDLAERLGRGAVAIRQHARTIGLARRVRARITWTAEADAILRAGYKRMPTAELAAELGTTVDALWARAKVLRLAQSRLSEPWTADDDQQLREWYGAMPFPEIAARLGRSHDSISNRVHTLGLTRETAVAERHARAQDEIAQLRAENDHLRHGALDAAHAPTADARRLAVLLAVHMKAIDADEAAVVLGVPPERLRVELGKAAKLGQDVVMDVLGKGRRCSGA